MKFSGNVHAVREDNSGSSRVRLKRTRNAVRFLMLLLLVAAFGLLTLAVLYYTRNTMEAMEMELCQKMQVSVEQTRSNMDYRFLQTAEDASTLMGTLYPYLNSNADTEEQLQEYSRICRALVENLDKNMISSLRLYVPDNKIYSGQQTEQYSLRSLCELENEEVLSHKGGVYWMEPHTVELGMASPVPVISCGLALKSQANYDKWAGVLFVDLDISQFQEIFASAGDGTCLVDGTGKILMDVNGIYAGQGGFTETQMEQIKTEESGYLTDENSIIAFSRLKIRDWYIVASMARHQVQSENIGTVNTIIAMWAVACLALFIIAFTAGYSLILNHTVHNINTAIRTLEMDDAGGQARGSSGRWGKAIFASLEYDTEQILRSVADIVEARYKDKLAISEYQMESLQEQIKPHFLYNTLDAIKWMILDEKQDDSVWMVNALSKYLRMSINVGEMIVPLSEELTLTNTYLGIMKKRFSHHFEVEYELEESVMDYLIPKLSLQPLVENALLHGILYCDKEDKRLTIRTWRSGQFFGIEIEDNGNGMPEEDARRLSEMNVHVGGSYGVANVHKRLDIFGHGKLKFGIVSHRGEGTCVTIELPIKRDGM